MKLFKKNSLSRNSIKETFDNQSNGICFFNQNGIPILCNRQMHRLAFTLTGRDLQNLIELKNALLQNPNVNDSCYYYLNGNTWYFKFENVIDTTNNKYTQVIAFDITELQEKRKLLIESNKAMQQTINTLKQIQNNVIEITKEEETLSMKIKLHNEFGYNLQIIRNFFAHGCKPEEKDSFLLQQRTIINKLSKNLENSDNIDSFKELNQLAKALDMNINITGILPSNKNLRKLLAMSIRECLINTIRHARGNKVYVKIITVQNNLRIEITNNGDQPQNKIIEGGGLSSLRCQIESNGGTMIIQALTRFILIITLPVEGVDNDD